MKNGSEHLVDLDLEERLAIVEREQQRIARETRYFHDEIYGPPGATGIKDQLASLDQKLSQRFQVVRDDIQGLHNSITDVTRQVRDVLAPMMKAIAVGVVVMSIAAAGRLVHWW